MTRSSVCRILLTDKDSTVTGIACRLYPLSFAVAPEEKLPALFTGLVEELRVLNSNGPEMKADPLLATLAGPEKERMEYVSINCLGALCSGDISVAICEAVLPYLKSNKAFVRAAAVQAILSQESQLEESDSCFFFWMITPFAADGNSIVRSIFQRFLNKQPLSVDIALKDLLPHSSDSMKLDSE